MKWKSYVIEHAVGHNCTCAGSLIPRIVFILVPLFIAVEMVTVFSVWHRKRLAFSKQT